MKKIKLFLASLAVSVLTFTGIASAGYPERPVEFVVVWIYVKQIYYGIKVI